MKRLINVLLLTGALAGPIALTAQDRRQESQHVRVYQDQRHHDTHEWNNDENQRYRSYLLERHQMKYRDFSRMSRRQKNSYWDWRHQH